MMEIQRWEVGFSQMNEHSQGEFITWNDHVAALKAARNELPDVGSWSPEPKFKVRDRVVYFGYIGTVETVTIYDAVAFGSPLVNYLIELDDGSLRIVVEWELTLYAPPVTTCGCPGGYSKVAEVPTSARPERKFKIGNQVTHRDSKKVRKIKNYYFSSEDNEWKYDIGFYYVESELTLYIAPTPAKLIPTLKKHEWVRGTYKTGTAFGPCTTYFNEIGAMFAGDNHLIHWTGKISDELATLERCDPPEVK